ncbi:MAG: TIGR00282 family metallophosphoesterase [bacterium]|nr:TIGR00282 family metallophosphoesterase [bacterium]
MPSKPAGALRVVFVGDIFGTPGVKAAERLLPGFLRAAAADFCIINGENSEQGKGISPVTARALFDAGADVITGGNHTLFRDKGQELAERDVRVLRPANLPEGTPGRGWGIFDARAGCRVGVLNLVGRAMLPPTDDPFRVGKRLIEEMRAETPLIIVDFHAEATAEKLAFARWVDGLITAVIGTHTHVQTADEQVLDGGAAYMTDVGMTGSHAGVIGLKTEHALHRFLHPMAGNKSGGAEGDVRLSGAVVDAQAQTGRALAIHRFQLRLPEE